MMDEPINFHSEGKMKRIFFILVSLLLFAGQTFAAEGMISTPSDSSVKETANRLEQILTNKGMTVFKRVKHSEAAAKVDIEMRDTELIIFGNPKVGSPHMQCQQSVAIDLPQKALIWEDTNGATWISYNDPRYVEKRHNIVGCEETISKIEKALAGIAKAASTK